jgi:hypothetical protein
MSKTLSVITLAFAVLGMNSQGAIRSFSPDGFTVTTFGNSNALLLNAQSQGVAPGFAWEAPIPNPSPTPPEALALTSPEQTSRSTRKTGTSTLFEAPIPNPSPVPPLALSMVIGKTLPGLADLDIIEAPIPNPSPIPPEAVAVK